MAPKKGKKKKSGKKRKSAKGPAIIDGISTEEMSKEQLEQHIHRLREGKGDQGPGSLDTVFYVWYIFIFFPILVPRKYCTNMSCYLT